MSKLTVQYERSDAWRDREFVATGNWPNWSEVTEFDLALATTEQRQEIAGFGKVDDRIGISGKTKLDAKPTLDEVLALYRVQRATEAEEKAAEDAKRERWAAEAQRDKDQRERWSREEKEKREAEQAARHAAKVAWVQAHGSDRLRRAVEREHDCTALYVRERAAVEAPGYVPDIYGAAKWKSAACPSVGALDAADAAEKLTLGTVEIVWLTDPPQAIKTRDEDEYGYAEEFSPREAVVIREYLGKYDLVLVL